MWHWQFCNEWEESLKGKIKLFTVLVECSLLLVFESSLVDESKPGIHSIKRDLCDFEAGISFLIFQTLN